MKLKNYECVISFDSHPAADLKRFRNSRINWFHREYQDNAPRGRGLLIEAEDGTVYIAGAGIRLTMRSEHDEGVPFSTIFEERNVNYHCVQEGYFTDEGEFVCTRIRSGDESDYGVYCTPDSGVLKVILGDESF